MIEDIPVSFRFRCFPILVFPHDRNGVIMAPVHSKVAVGGDGAVVLIGDSRACGQGQGIGIVPGVQGYICTSGRIFRIDPVPAVIYAGRIVHAIVGKAQPYCVLAAGKVAGHIHDMTGVLGRAAYVFGDDPAVFPAAVPVAGDGHNIILIQIVKGQGARAAEVFGADTGPGGHGYDIGMYVCRGLHSVRRQFLIIGNIGAELIGHVADGNRRACRICLSARGFHSHIDDGAAGLRPQLFLRLIAQIAFAGSVNLTVFQIAYIRIIFFFAGNIPVSDRYFAGCLNIFRSADITAVCVIQFSIRQRPCAVEAAGRGAYPQRHRRVHLGKGILGCHFHICYAGIGPAPDAAADIIINLAYRRRNAGSYGFTTVCRVGKGKVCAAGHLDIAVISPVLHQRAGTGSIR